MTKAKRFKKKTQLPVEVANQMIAVTPTQKERLRKIGEMGNTYSDIVELLLNLWEST